MEGYLEREEKKKKGSGICAFFSPCLFSAIIINLIV